MGDRASSLGTRMGGWGDRLRRWGEEGSGGGGGYRGTIGNAYARQTISPGVRSLYGLY
jgi:hypothetical protein